MSGFAVRWFGITRRRPVMTARRGSAVLVLAELVRLVRPDEEAAGGRPPVLKKDAFPL